MLARIRPSSSSKSSGPMYWFVHSRRHAISKAARRHVPGAVLSLMRASHHHAVEEDVALPRSIGDRQAVLAGRGSDIANKYPSSIDRVRAAIRHRRGRVLARDGKPRELIGDLLA